MEMTDSGREQLTVQLCTAVQTFQRIRFESVETGSCIIDFQAVIGMKTTTYIKLYTYILDVVVGLNR